jgi:hypothetical protein
VSPPSLKKFSPSFICFLLIGKVCNGVIRVPQDAADHSADNLLRAICCAENTKNRCKMQTWGDVSAQMYCIDKVEIRAQQAAADDSLDNLWRSELLCAKNKEMQKWRDMSPPFELFKLFYTDGRRDPAALGCLSYLCCTSFS